MTPSHARYAVSIFVLLSAGVAGNVMFLQGEGSSHGNPNGGRAASERKHLQQEADRARRLSADQPATTVNSAQRLPNTQPFSINPPTVSPTIAPIVRSDPKRPQDAAKKSSEAVAEATLSGPAADAPEVVASIQRELQARGYDPGVSDGVAGAVTRAAIMAWEHDHGLAPTGEATEAVMKAIVLGVSKATAAQISTQWQALPKEKRQRGEQLVRTVQQSLSALGYNPGKVTGRSNEDTERAIREFETDQNMVQSGRVSGPLVSRLGRLTAAGRPTGTR